MHEIGYFHFGAKSAKVLVSERGKTALCAVTKPLVSFIPESLPSVITQSVLPTPKITLVQYLLDMESVIQNVKFDEMNSQILFPGCFSTCVYVELIWFINALEVNYFLIS